MHGAKSLESISLGFLRPINKETTYAMKIVIILPRTEKYKYEILCKPKLSGFCSGANVKFLSALQNSYVQPSIETGFVSKTSSPARVAV